MAVFFCKNFSVLFGSVKIIPTFTTSNKQTNNMTTSTRTFGKAAMKEAMNFFPTAKTLKKYGTKMNQFINFYDENGKHLGYWTNERKDFGVLRAY